MNDNYLIPLFWQHGESEDILREEICQMQSKGIHQFIVESRPHPGYLKDGWWRDLSIIIDEAKKRDMKVWIFDDGVYPSGAAAGIIKERYPQHMKKFLKEKHIDCVGPLTGSSFRIAAWLWKEEELLGVVAVKRHNKSDALIFDGAVDITDKITDGILYWDVPEGDWRVFVLKITSICPEPHTRDYLNPLDRKPVEAFIEIVHEEHYKRFASEFGKTIAGFFTDEPRFGSGMTYNGRLGDTYMDLPWSDTLLAELSAVYAAAQGETFMRFLPLLWYGAGGHEVDVRYTYMNAVSRRFGENFCGLLGKWCEDHGVKLIGHVVEDNGAHARLGYGAGHFFRSTKGLAFSGLDVVYNIFPGYTEGSYDCWFFRCDSVFNHWGTTKMASSAGHIYAEKNGITVCEAFGAYGWQEGLKLMKWITDHICVRGVNIIIPHAFSPKEFEDPDCPPHFYARGMNPQWKDFQIWSTYANRLCAMLTGGVHVATAAVLYHAEAEWGGKYEPFEYALKALMERQIDADVVPVDILIDENRTAVCGGKLFISKEDYSALIIPYSQYLPQSLIERITFFGENGLPVFFMNGLPERGYYQKKNCNIEGKICTYENIADSIIDMGLNDIIVNNHANDLRFYHYRKDGKETYFFVNESSRKSVYTGVKFREKGNCVLYDAMDDVYYEAEKDGDYVSISLAPYQSVFVIFTNEKPNTAPCPFNREYKNNVLITGEWHCGIAEAKEYPDFIYCDKIKGPGNISVPGILPAFSGTVKYEIAFNAPEGITDSSQVMLDLGEVYETARVSINGAHIGTKICPPYLFAVPSGLLSKTENQLVAEVTNTLVKKHGDNNFDRSMPQEPSGLLGPIRMLY